MMRLVCLALGLVFSACVEPEPLRVELRTLTTKRGLPEVGPRTHTHAWVEGGPSLDTDQVEGVTVEEISRGLASRRTCASVTVFSSYGSSCNLCPEEDHYEEAVEQLCADLPIGYETASFETPTDEWTGLKVQVSLTLLKE